MMLTLGTMNNIKNNEQVKILKWKAIIIIITIIIITLVSLRAAKFA